MKFPLLVAVLKMHLKLRGQFWQLPFSCLYFKQNKWGCDGFKYHPKQMTLIK